MGRIHLSAASGPVVARRKHTYMGTDPLPPGSLTRTLLWTQEPPPGFKGRTQSAVRLGPSACGTSPALLPLGARCPDRWAPRRRPGLLRPRWVCGGALGEAGGGRRALSPCVFLVPCPSRWLTSPRPRPDPCAPPSSSPWTLGGPGCVCGTAPETSHPRLSEAAAPVPAPPGSAVPFWARHQAVWKCVGCVCDSSSGVSHSGSGSSPCLRSLCGGRMCTTQGLTASEPCGVQTPVP